MTFLHLKIMSRRWNLRPGCGLVVTFLKGATWAAITKSFQAIEFPTDQGNDSPLGTNGRGWAVLWLWAGQVTPPQSPLLQLLLSSLCHQCHLYPHTRGGHRPLVLFHLGDSQKEPQSPPSPFSIKNSPVAEVCLCPGRAQIKSVLHFLFWSSAVQLSALHWQKLQLFAAWPPLGAPGTTAHPWSAELKGEMWDFQQHLQHELCPGSLMLSLWSIHGAWQGHILQKCTSEMLGLLKMSHKRRSCWRVGRGPAQRGLLMCRTRA